MLHNRIHQELGLVYRTDSSAGPKTCTMSSRGHPSHHASSDRSHHGSRRSREGSSNSRASHQSSQISYEQMEVEEPSPSLRSHTSSRPASSGHGSHHSSREQSVVQHEIPSSPSIPLTQNPPSTVPEPTDFPFEFDIPMELPRRDEDDPRILKEMDRILFRGSIVDGKEHLLTLGHFLSAGSNDRGVDLFMRYDLSHISRIRIYFTLQDNFDSPQVLECVHRVLKRMVYMANGIMQCNFIVKLKLDPNSERAIKDAGKNWEQILMKKHTAKHRFLSMFYALASKKDANLCIEQEVEEDNSGIEWV